MRSWRQIGENLQSPQRTETKEKPPSWTSSPFSLTAPSFFGSLQLPLAARQKETLKAWVRARLLLRLQIFQRIRVLLQIKECKCVWLHSGWKFLAGANVGPYLAVTRRLFAHPGWTTALGLENVKMGCACFRCHKAELGGGGLRRRNWV